MTLATVIHGRCSGRSFRRLLSRRSLALPQPNAAVPPAASCRTKVVNFKALVVQASYNLSDEQTEYQFYDGL